MAGKDTDIETWRETFRALVLSFGSGLRYTQDSPVVPDVWMHYADHPAGAAPLIIVPDYRTSSTDLSKELAFRISELSASGMSEDEMLSLWETDNPIHKVELFALTNDVAARLHLSHLCRHVISMTSWWQDEDNAHMGIRPESKEQKKKRGKRERADGIFRFVKQVREFKDKLTGKGEETDKAIPASKDEVLHAIQYSNDKPVWRFFAIITLLYFAESLEKSLTGKDDDGDNWGFDSPFRNRWEDLLDNLKKEAGLESQELLPEKAKWLFLGAISQRLLNLNDDVADARNREKQTATDEEPQSLAIADDGALAFFLIQGVHFIEDFLQDTIKRAEAKRKLGIVPRVLEIWRINLNRDFRLALSDSRKTVKADAAARLFEQQTNGIVWAVVDSGIDATHPAFHERKDGKTLGPEFDSDDQDGSAPIDHLSRKVLRRAAVSRIKKTFDFTRLMQFLKGDFEQLIDGDDAGHLVVDELATEMPRGRATAAYLITRHLRYYDKPSQLAKAAAKDPEEIAEQLVEDYGKKEWKDEVTTALRELERYVLLGREIYWPLVEPVIWIPHEFCYRPPQNPHGTHVAGILCGDLRRGEISRLYGGSDRANPFEDILGVCPDMHVYDFRVCDAQGHGEEFVVLAALQFIHHLNRDRDKMQVQGINISLSLQHDMRNFACGRTPVCLEAERLVSNGVVVVAAAGNLGVTERITASGKREGYNDISITDPGNAEAVITVGSTHRREPHAYGVSFFSSRGPTGDGRQKPDIVAPGEKIKSPVPRLRVDVMDGTSMAAPHVSGAAAIVMARHRELIRQPQRIKEILCSTATDLGRERRFQGAGLVDILRALQSV